MASQKRKTRFYMMSTVVSLFAALGLIVALVVVKSHSSNSGMSSVTNAADVNMGHIPDIFSADVMTTRQSALPSAAPHVAPLPTESTRILHWYQDRKKGVKDLTFHRHHRHNKSDEYRIITDLHNMVQTVESTGANTCMLLAMDPSSGLDTNFRAVSTVSTGPVTVHGRSCNGYKATRADGKIFTYTIDPVSGAVCDIRVGRTVYTMTSFTANAPRPEYSDACHASFDAVVAEKMNGGNGAGSIRPHIQPLAKFETQLSWNPITDAKDIWGDVTKWAGDVYKWGEAHYCELCEPIMDQVIDKGSEYGSDFVCDAATDGAAADFCGALAEDAIKAGCKELDCAKKICSAIGRRSC
jgi:hypothetical protein